MRWVFFIAACAGLALPHPAEARKGMSFGGAPRAAPARPAPAAATAPKPKGGAVVVISNTSGQQNERPPSMTPRIAPWLGAGAAAAVVPAAAAIPASAATESIPTGVAPPRMGEPARPMAASDLPGFKTAN